jgi:hypothetical protein
MQLNISADTNVIFCILHVLSLFDIPKYLDPLHKLLEYIAMVRNLCAHHTTLFGRNKGSYRKRLTVI